MSEKLLCGHDAHYEHSTLLMRRALFSFSASRRAPISLSASRYLMATWL